MIDLLSKSFTADDCAVNMAEVNWLIPFVCDCWARLMHLFRHYHEAGDAMKNLKNLMKNVPGKLAVAAAIVASFSVQAGTLDLTLGGTGTIGAATFSTNTQQPTGTGVIDPFVQLGGANPPIKQAYNTTVNNVYDNTSPDNWNHAIRVGNIGFIDLGGGVTVMRFLLDINQTDSGTNSLLTLDEVQLFISLTPNQSIEPSLGTFDVLGLADSALVYQMDADPEDNAVLMEYSLNSGSGTGDIYMDIPLSAFESAFTALGLASAMDKNNAFIYLYSRVGEGYPNNDGFEEWAAFTGQPLVDTECPRENPPPECVTPPLEIPEPASMAILGAGLIGMAIARRRGKIV